METKILGFLRSRTFFIAIMVLFALESAWIAISAAYPMVFDENTHFRLVQLHAAQWWSPVFWQAPADSNFAGAVTRDPSYLYHYLMSFPYLLISHISHSQMVQVVFLRFINIALFGAGLVLFWRLLRKTKVSLAIINVSLLLFVLIPVVPLLAGQINYDNLIMPLVALALLMTISIADKLAKKKLPIAEILSLLTLCLLSCLVKFEFAPIFAAIVLWLGWKIISGVWKKDLKLKLSLKTGWRRTNRNKKLAIGVPLIISAAMFFQMYGISTIVYHTPLPHCDQVISADQCMAYAPYQRDVIAIADKQETNPNPVLFAVTWVYRMFIAMFYTSSGGAGPGAMYLSINPLPVIFGAALLLFIVGCGLIVRYHNSLFRGYSHLGFLLFVVIVYCAMLFGRNYMDYMVVGQKIAMNGRYLFPIALPVMLIFALGFRKMFGHRAHLRLAMLAAIFVLFLQGGGALTYIVASKESWYWNNSFVVKLNDRAESIVGRVVVAKEPIGPVTFTQRQQ